MHESNPYTAAREAAEVELERYVRLVEDLRIVEDAWPHSDERLRGLANSDGRSWAEAIVGILKDGKPRTVNVIVDELIARGREFGPRSRPDAVIRRALCWGATQYRWVASDKKPVLWRKAKKGEKLPSSPHGDPPPPRSS